MTLNIRSALAAAFLAALPAAGMSATVVTDLNTSISNNGETINVDLNQDGHDDFRLGIGVFFSQGGAGWAQAFSDQFRFVGGDPNGPIVSTYSLVADNPGPILGLGFFAPYQEVSFAAADDALALFSAGDSIDEGDFVDSLTFGSLYGQSDSVLPNVGDSGYIGIRIEMGESEYQNLDGYLPTGFYGDTEVFYGFLNIEHGSVIAGLAGYNNAAGQAAVIPGGTTNPSAVPLPASALLLGGAMAGFAVMRRRKG